MKLSKFHSEAGGSKAAPLSSTIIILLSRLMSFSLCLWHLKDGFAVLEGFRKTHSNISLQK
ncbi:MAG: hypothetical protein A2104_04245 [Candidatus Melainabacteria bacterium GWF2_32_7]|nr:MAG: hypothetical protein A2104_04245 [Candidatus Melainabacteria bacterium GWF2_32_7]